MRVGEKQHYVPEFKGERNYIQGGDIAAALAEHIGHGKSITIQLHAMVTQPFYIMRVSDTELARIRASGQFSALMAFVREDKTRELYVVTEEVVECAEQRITYDELAITNNSFVSGRKIVQDEWYSGNVFERVVALNKKLLNTCIEQHPWVFSRIDLSSWPVKPIGLDIELKNEIGKHTYKSLVKSDGDVLGFIYFTRQQK